MTTFNHLAKQMGLALLMLFGIFSSSPVFANTSPANSGYSGEELVRGILLANGAVASKLPGLQDFSIGNFSEDAKVQSELNGFHDRVINQIAEDNPYFFASFKEQIDSRRHATIRSAIENAKTVVSKAMDKVNGQSRFTMDAETKRLATNILERMGSTGSISEATNLAKSYLSSQSTTYALAPCQAIAVETATIAVAVRVAVAVYSEYFFWPSEINSAAANNRIFQDTIIDAITKL